MSKMSLHHLFYTWSCTEVNLSLSRLCPSMWWVSTVELKWQAPTAETRGNTHCGQDLRRESGSPNPLHPTPWGLLMKIPAKVSCSLSNAMRELLLGTKPLLKVGGQWGWCILYSSYCFYAPVKSFRPQILTLHHGARAGQGIGINCLCSLCSCSNYPAAVALCSWAEITIFIPWKPIFMPS